MDLRKFKTDHKSLIYPEELLKSIAGDDKNNHFDPTLTMVGAYLPIQWFEQEFERKLNLLFAHFQVNKTSANELELLVRRLVMDWIPGFRFVSRAERRGRTKNGAEMILIAEAIDGLFAANPQMNLGMACREFRKKQSRKSPLGKLHVRSIERKYRQGKNLMQVEKALYERVTKQSVPLS